MAGTAGAAPVHPSPFGATSSGLSTTTSQPAPTIAKASDTVRPVLARGDQRPTRIARPVPCPVRGEISLAGNDAKLASSAKPAESLLDKKTEGEKTHVIVAGETFTSLAVKYFGHAKYTSLIVKANPNVDPAQKCGSACEGHHPPAPESTTAMASPSPDRGPDFSVGDADGRTDLADGGSGDQGTSGSRGSGVHGQGGRGVGMRCRSRFLGNGERWTELYELNKEARAQSAPTIPAGTVIELPKDAQHESRRDSDEQTGQPGQG